MYKPQNTRATSHASAQAEAVADRQVTTDPVVEPFLHFEGQQIYLERGQNHLEIVLRNVDYLSRHKIAPQMEIVVLGRGDHRHKDDFHKIRDRYANSSFEVKYYEVMNRGGNIPLGLKPSTPHRRLCGCAQTGSRPLQWVHITSHGKWVLCCQDYHEQHVIGDLNEQSLDEILGGPKMALLRRWVYGLDEAPTEFICRNCVFARTE